MDRERRDSIDEPKKVHINRKTTLVIDFLIRIIFIVDIIITSVITMIITITIYCQLYN